MLREESNVVKFLKTLRDDRSDLDRAFVFLHTLQKKSVREPVPLLEIITVIRVEKPLVYNYLKTRSKNIPGLNLLFELSMDYGLAKERIGMKE